MFDPAGIDWPKTEGQDRIFGDISDVFVEDALNAVARVTNTSWKALNPTMIFVTRQAKNQQPEEGAPPVRSPVITLSAAVRTRDQAMVVRFVLEGADVNARDVKGITPIEYAVAEDYPEAASFLLEHGADIASIHLPAGRNLLHAVCMKCSANLIQPLVNAGADPTQRDRFGETPLDLALAYKNEKAVGELLKLSDMQTVAEEAMDGATVRGQTETARLLLDNGLDVNKPTATGATYLGDAALKGQKAMVRLLLNHGAKTGLRNQFGGTALHDAALGGSAEVIGMLLDGGAEIDARNLETGATPLMQAASLGKLEAVNELLKRGTNPHLRDNAGHTAVIPPTSSRPLPPAPPRPVA
jgi:ankyrin repeat protein